MTPFVRWLNPLCAFLCHPCSSEEIQFQHCLLVEMWLLGMWFLGKVFLSISSLMWLLLGMWLLIEVLLMFLIEVWLLVVLQLVINSVSPDSMLIILLALPSPATKPVLDSWLHSYTTNLKCHTFRPPFLCYLFYALYVLCVICIEVTCSIARFPAAQIFQVESSQEGSSKLLVLFDFLRLSDSIS